MSERVALYPGSFDPVTFGHIDLNYQLELKADVLEEALSRMAGITMRPVVEQAPGDDLANGLGYRTRVQLHVDELGNVVKVGLLLRQAADGSLSRMVVSGRVLYGERIRDALIRHLEKDLGPVALPQITPSPSPFTGGDVRTTQSRWARSVLSTAGAGRNQASSTSAAMMCSRR